MNLKQRLGKRKIKDSKGGGYVAMWTNLYNPSRSVPVAMSNDYDRMKEYINQHCEIYVREQGARIQDGGDFNKTVIFEDGGVYNLWVKEDIEVL